MFQQNVQHITVGDALQFVAGRKQHLKVMPPIRLLSISRLEPMSGKIAQGLRDDLAQSFVALSVEIELAPSACGDPSNHDSTAGLDKSSCQYVFDFP